MLPWNLKVKTSTPVMFGSKGIPEYPEPHPTGIKCGNFTSGGFGEYLPALRG